MSKAKKKIRSHIKIDKKTGEATAYYAHAGGYHEIIKPKPKLKKKSK